MTGSFGPQGGRHPQVEHRCFKEFSLRLRDRYTNSFLQCAVAMAVTELVECATAAQNRGITSVRGSVWAEVLKLFTEPQPTPTGARE